MYSPLSELERSKMLIICQYFSHDYPTFSVHPPPLAPYVAGATQPSGCWQRLLLTSMSPARRCVEQNRATPRPVPEAVDGAEVAAAARSEEEEVEGGGEAGCP